MSTSGIYADIYSSFVSDPNLLPALPEITLTIRQKLRDPNCTNKVAADLLKSDPGLAAFIMRTSNSVRYMLRRPPGDIESAVLRLGLSTTLNLATTYATSSMFSVSSPALKKILLESYKNATKVAVLSYFLAEKVPGIDSGKAMLAGLLQDIALPPLLTRLKKRPDIFNDKDRRLAAIDELSPVVNSLILELWGFDEEIIESVNIKNQIEAGDLVDEHLSEKDKINLLTALMPDIHGNIWFTSRHGIVGLIHRDDLTEEGCMRVYASYIGFFGTIDKINKHFDTHFKSFEDIELYRKIENFNLEFKNKFRELFMTTEDTREEIQNSFSIGKDGVYIVSNYALYKLRFNEENKQIELDPEWVETYKEGNLVYNNDRKVKPGQLNAGSGTTPTLMDDRFVAICDNDSLQVNLCIYSQESGKLISKHKLFTNNGGAVENSVVAYGNSFIVANTYGYEDPFKDNNTPGGIMRFDFNEQKGIFEWVKNWPASGTYDCKTATPKLSTPVGMMYVYNRSEEDHEGHFDWQITGIDYRTGLRVFYIKSYFEKGDFGDNISFLLKWGSLGSKHYDRKVFNNIWATFTIGPNNSFYIGAYRGFLRVSSD